MTKNKIFLGIKVTDYEILVFGLSTVRANEHECLFKIRESLKAGTVERGRIKDKKLLAQAFSVIKKQVKDNGAIDYVASFSVPENLTYYLHVPVSSSGEGRDEVIEKAIREDLPFDFLKVKYDYVILPEFGNSEQSLAHIFAMEKEVYQEWEKFFENEQIKIYNFCLEALANFEALSETEKNKSNIVAVLDVGRRNTNLAFYKNDSFLLSVNIKYASNDILEELSDLYNIQVSAEDYSKSWPFEKEKSYLGNFQEIVRKLSQRVGKEINEVEKMFADKIDQLLVIGEIANRTEFLTVFTEELGLSVKKAELQKIGVERFSVPFGLSLLARRKEKKKICLSFSTRQKKNYKKNKIKNYFEKVLPSGNNFFIRYRQDIVVVFIICFTILAIITVARQGKEDSGAKISDPNPPNYNFEVPFLVTQTASSSWVMAEKMNFELERFDNDSNLELVVKKKISELVPPEKIFFIVTDLGQYEDSIILPLNIDYLLVNTSLFDQYVAGFFGLTKLKILETQLKKSLDEQMYYFDIKVLSQNKLQVKTPNKVIPNLIKIQNLSQSLNIRSGPGSKFSVIGKALPGEEFISFSKQEGWIEVLLESGEFGWLAERFVEKATF